MFQEEYEKLSRGERSQFSEVVNDLLYECFIPRKLYDRKASMFKANPDYLFLERHLSLFKDYLSFMEIEVNQAEDDGLFYVVSALEKNHLRIDVVTTLIVFALRSYYEEAIGREPETIEVDMTYGSLAAFLQEKGLSNLTKRLSSTTIASSLRTLDSFNVVTRHQGNYGDPSYRFFILPTIRYVISSEKMNALYNFLTKPEEEAESTSLFDLSPKEENLHPEDIPVEETK